MATINLPPYTKWRDGRPRWEPGPKLRQGGWTGRDLKDRGGNWLALADAIRAAEVLNDEVAAWRAGGGRGAPRRRATPAVNTVGQLVAEWRQSPKFQRKRASTQRDYLTKARVFTDRFGDEPVAALAKHHLYAWWQQLYEARGHAMANGVLAVVRLILSHAERIGWTTGNPARQLGLETVPPRVVVWSPSEIESFVAAADASGQAWLADAIVIALHTGQRQGDVLALTDPRVVDGRAYFVQGKTAARVAVPLTPPLERRIAMIRARRATLPGIVDLAAARRLIVRPDGQPVTGDQLRKAFCATRARLSRDMPELAGRTFQDLRDTAVTRLALAGCTVPEIRAITGHTMQTVHQVLQHYLALDDRMADNAIDRLKVWMHEEGIAL